MTDQINSAFEPTDSQMLEWMIEKSGGVRIADGLYTVQFKHPTYGAHWPAEGYPIQWYRTGREAIKAAMKKVNK